MKQVQRSAIRENRSTQRPDGHRAPVAPHITQDAIARSLVENAARLEQEHGCIGKDDLEAMLKRAMDSQPGQMNAAAADAIDHIVAHHKLASDAQPMAEVLNDAKRCRDTGVIREADLEGMMRRAWDAKSGAVDKSAATALRFVGWRDAPIMDAGARQLMTEFVSAWWQDMVESPAVAEGRRQIEEQLAQDKRDFKDFVKTDKADHKKQHYEAFREGLKNERVEASEWQTLMLWLQTGAKRNPLSS